MRRLIENTYVVRHDATGQFASNLGGGSITTVDDITYAIHFASIQLATKATEHLKSIDQYTVVRVHTKHVLEQGGEKIKYFHPTQDNPQPLETYDNRNTGSKGKIEAEDRLGIIAGMGVIGFPIIIFIVEVGSRLGLW